MLLAFLVLTASFTPLAQAYDAPEVALAAEQKDINAETLRFEADEYDALFRWQKATDQLVMAKTEAKLKEKELRRAEKLVKAGTITQENFVTTRFLYQRSQNEILRLTAEAIHFRGEIDVARLNILYYGNPGSAGLNAIAEARLAEREAMLVALQAGIASLETEKELTALRLECGIRLQGKGAVAETELENRIFNLDNVSQRLDALKNQISMVENAIASARKNLKALNAR
jgi:hypothetical protein